MTFARTMTLMILAGVLAAAPAAWGRTYDEVQAPRAQDIQAPREQAVQAPRGDEIQAPRNGNGHEFPTQRQ